MRVSVVPLLDRPTYLYAEVDRLVGVRPGTSRRWINGYERGGRHYAPILRTRPEPTEWATWGEFVETRMLSELRDRSVRTANIRAAVEQLRERFAINYPLAHLAPYLTAQRGEVALRSADSENTDTLEVVRTGQLILESARPVFERATLANDSDGRKFAAEVALDPDFPDIIVNPDRLSGQPTFNGRRIAIATIAGMVSAGEAPADIAADYSLSLTQVDEAVQYARKHKLAA